MQLQAAIEEIKELWDRDLSKSRDEIEVIEKYSQIFSLENIHSLTAEDFRSFLNYKNNRHWKNLERAGYRLADDMPVLRKTLRILLDESIPITSRIRRIRDKTSSDYLPWFGPAYYTPILLITNPQKYPVVNSIVKFGLERLGIYANYDSKDEWIAYSEASLVISNLAKENKISLWQLDWVWWEISKSYDFDKLYDFINKRNRTNELDYILIIRTLLQKGSLSKDELDRVIFENNPNRSIAAISQIYNKLANEFEIVEEMENGQFKLNFSQPLEDVEKQKLIELCNYNLLLFNECERLATIGVSDLHIKILQKFFRNKGKYLDADKIYGIKKASDIKKLPLPADDIVDQPHYLHNLITGVYSPAGDEFALSIQLNPSSRWDLEIDREFPTLRINYDFGSNEKYFPQMKKLQNCFENDIPVGLIFKTGRAKNKILGLGKITSFSDNKFVIDSYLISEEESRNIKEETISEFDRSISDPAIARINSVDYKKLLSEINFDEEKFMHHKSQSPDTRRIRIDQIIDYCESGEWVIPKFQRYFDWKKEDVRDFLKSILLNYYVGALLLWDIRREEELDVMPIQGTPINSKLIKNSIILDGQQRITSLYYAIKSPEYSLNGDNKKRSFFYIDFYEFFTSNETENLIRVFHEKIDEEESFRKMLFPIYELSNPYPWLDQFESFLERNESTAKSNIRSTKRIIENRLRYMFSNFEIPYVTIPNDRSLEQVTEIFEKINSSGKQLDIFDLLIARLSKYDINLRELWDESRKNHKIVEYEGRKGVKKLPIYILQSLALCYTKSKSCNRKDILNIFNNMETDKDDFVSKWRYITSYTLKAIGLLENTRDGFGVIHPTELPFEPIIPVLTSLLKEMDEKFKDYHKKCFDKLHNWYWTSVFSLSYSGAVDSQKTSDFKEMMEWFLKDDRVPKNISEFRLKYPWQLNLKDIDTESSAIYKGILSLVTLKGGNDFDKNRAITNQKYHKDHIFPKSKYSQYDNINSILNITWLTSDTNQRIKRSKNISNYIDETIQLKFGSSEDDFLNTLNSHFISKSAYLSMKENDFENFINEREKTILKEIGKRIGSDLYEDQTLPSMTSPHTPYTNLKIIRKALEECRGTICWIDKYFSTSDLDILSESTLDRSVKEIKILISLKSSDEKMRNNFTRFRKEMLNKNIKSEMRVVADSKTYGEYHDRWVLSQTINYNLMSGDTAKRGQYAEIKRTENVPPFERWWNKSLDIVNDFDQILQNRKRAVAS